MSDSPGREAMLSNGPAPGMSLPDKRSWSVLYILSKIDIHMYTHMQTQTHLYTYSHMHAHIHSHSVSNIHLPKIFMLQGLPVIIRAYLLAILI